MKTYEISFKCTYEKIYLEDDDEKTKLKVIEKAMKEKAIVEIEGSLIDATTIGAIILIEDSPRVVKKKDGTYTIDGQRCSRHGEIDQAYVKRLK